MNRFFLLTAIIFSLFLMSCASDSEPLYSEYIDVDPGKEELNDAEQAAMLKLGERISDNLQFNSDGTISLTKSAAELNICTKAYTATQDVISWYNEKVKEYGSAATKAATKVATEDDGDKTNTRGGNDFSDSIASLISSVFEEMECLTSKKLFDQWYFKCRTSDYQMTTDEWNTLLPVANAQLKDTYSQFPTLNIGDSAYHSVQVSFYDTEEIDLMLSYGRATMYYTLDGKASGFYDVYDFNITQAERSTLLQIAVIVVNYLGGGDGYKIYYGVHS